MPLNRLSRFHSLLRVDTGRPVYCEAQDAEQAPDAKAEGVAPGGMAADARRALRARVKGDLGRFTWRYVLNRYVTTAYP